jgi:hypothetical protein
MADQIKFEILWYSGGPEYAPNRCIGREDIMGDNLDEAIKFACLKLMRQRTENTKLARGFYVREKKGD